MRCLRDTVLLLHGLSQKDKLFIMHCVEVLHQYDQVMPGVSMLIRGLPDVTDCEGEPARGPPAQPPRLLPEVPQQLIFLGIPSAGPCPLQPVPALGSFSFIFCPSSSPSILGCLLLLSVECAWQSHSFSRNTCV